MNDGRVDGPDGDGLGDAIAIEALGSADVGDRVGTRAPVGMHAPSTTTTAIPAVANQPSRRVMAASSSLFAGFAREARTVHRSSGARPTNDLSRRTVRRVHES